MVLRARVKVDVVLGVLVRLRGRVSVGIRYSRARARVMERVRVKS